MRDNDTSSGRPPSFRPLKRRKICFGARSEAAQKLVDLLGGAGLGIDDLLLWNPLSEQSCGSSVSATAHALFQNSPLSLEQRRLLMELLVNYARQGPLRYAFVEECFKGSGKPLDAKAQKWFLSTFSQS
uniref:Uncharacterized protein n=1 Tax=Odontella aurita TaxID=265563 RepID=A0A7S4K507_9STRA|mmetsp:Transcript_61175/g.180936  ORF Transcript_61175/g.180936 Transcript_61175/m.180936 type:complete len:129 (+) Transcript_61175:399-785(+)|eukprot:CAMPEP_0113576052 /NCGR_PEP_ID=MMETSP0015_2-20120614/28066_1 /TAXON_ID=2838 /ORGANISM="Odontella" /LENGTH=128 /DNA_ID=CAMNT_0000479413 /DNA_START=177 /DNA_END=563 /DNA_ORIENTATION=- /assembly_acc=CAM_ASM_000160